MFLLITHFQVDPAASSAQALLDAAEPVRLLAAQPDTRMLRWGRSTEDANRLVLVAEFDTAAKKAMQALASAKAQRDLQELRNQRQSELAGLSGMQGSSTALSALTRRAQSVSNEAAGLKIVADVTQKPHDQAAEIDAIRKSVISGDTAGESALDRLKRLSGKSAPDVPRLTQ